MPRKRTLKPGLFKCGELWDAAGPEGVLLFQSLWTIADRKGRLADRPSGIQADACPLLRIDIDTTLWALHNSGFILRYIVGGLRYIQIVNFSKHQDVYPDEKDSQIPPLQGFEPGKCTRKGSNAFYSPSTLNGTPIDALLDTLVNDPINAVINNPIEKVVNDPSGKSLYPSIPVSLDKVVEKREVVGGVGENSESETFAADAATHTEDIKPIPKAKRVPKTVVPLDFQPSEKALSKIMATYMVSREDVAYHTEEFIAHWTEGKGAGEKRPGWEASWRTWMNGVDWSKWKRNRAGVPSLNGNGAVPHIETPDELAVKLGMKLVPYEVAARV